MSHVLAWATNQRGNNEDTWLCCRVFSPLGFVSGRRRSSAKVNIWLIHTQNRVKKKQKWKREREREREKNKKKKNYIQCDCHFRLFCLPLASVHARPRVKPPSSDSCFNSVITVAQIRIRNTASATRLMTVIHLPLLWWPIFPITEPLSNFPTLRPVHLPSSRSIIAGLSWFLANIRAEIGPNRRVWLTLASIVWHLPFYLIDL